MSTFIGNLTPRNTSVETGAVIPPGVIEDLLYVAQTAIVTGTRDGSWDAPFEFIQDAVDAYGAPVDAADYNRQATIQILDKAVYSENVVLGTRRYSFVFPGGTPTGSWTMNIDNALRFGSSFSPGVDIYSATRPLGTQFIGNFLMQLAGTAVTNIAARLTNVNWTGNFTIADGTNGGASVTSGTASQLSLTGSSISGTFLGRNTGIAGFNAAIVGNVEAQTILSSTELQLLGSSISLYGTSTTTRTIKGLNLSSAGGVVWTNVNVGPRWSADSYTWAQLFLRTTGSYSNAFVPQGTLAALTAVDNTDLSTELAAFPNTLAVINNTRTRGVEVENRLSTIKLIP